MERGQPKHWFKPLNRFVLGFGLLIVINRAERYDIPPSMDKDGLTQGPVVLLGHVTQVIAEQKLGDRLRVGVEMGGGEKQRLGRVGPEIAIPVLPHDRHDPAAEHRFFVCASVVRKRAGEERVGAGEGGQGESG